jgi:predicted nucleic acid-binding protein
LKVSDALPVVADAGPLIILSAIGKIDLLGDLYGSVLIPDAVFFEVTTVGADRPGSAELLAASWAIRAEVQPPPDLLLAWDLGAGESEAITLALRRHARLLLLDDRRARQIAEIGYGLRVKGAPGILVEAKQRGLIRAVQPLLEEMRARGYFLAQSVIDRAISEAGEGALH